jgi:hypothetical protein
MKYLVPTLDACAVGGDPEDVVIDRVQNVAPIRAPRHVGYGGPVGQPSWLATRDWHRMNGANARTFVPNKCQRLSIPRDVERPVAHSRGRLGDLMPGAVRQLDAQDSMRTLVRAISDKQRSAIRVHPTIDPEPKT